MKLQELGISTTTQILKPQSPGSRGIALNKNRPAKRYFDSGIAKLTKDKKTNQ